MNINEGYTGLELAKYYESLRRAVTDLEEYLNSPDLDLENLEAIEEYAHQHQRQIYELLALLEARRQLL